VRHHHLRVTAASKSSPHGARGAASRDKCARHSAFGPGSASVTQHTSQWAKALCTASHAGAVVCQFHREEYLPRLALGCRNPRQCTQIGGIFSRSCFLSTRWIGLDAHRPYPWKEPTKCIFCGVSGSLAPGGSLAQEHLFSNWTRRFVPRSMKNYESLRATSHRDRTDFVPRGQLLFRIWPPTAASVVCHRVRSATERPTTLSAP
jgi:hypothetical protein